MVEINQTTSTTTYNVDIKKLQANETLSVHWLMKEFGKLLEALSKALGTKNLDTIHVVHKENETPIKAFISQNLNKKDGPINIQKLNTAITRTLKDTDTLSGLIAFAADNESKKARGETRPEFLNKIKIPLEPTQKQSTNIAMAPAQKPQFVDPTGGKIKSADKTNTGQDVFVYANLNVEQAKQFLSLIVDPDGKNSYKDIMEGLA